MPQATMEERVNRLEEQLADVQRKIATSEEPWWKRIVGVYQDDPSFDEAEGLGREWRESFRPKLDEVAPL